MKNAKHRESYILRNNNTIATDAPVYNDGTKHHLLKPVDST